MDMTIEPQEKFDQSLRAGEENDRDWESNVREAAAALSPWQIVAKKF